MTVSELRQGCEVSFRNGDEILRGIVNGTPWLFWNGERAQARVPVFVSNGNKCIDVAGENIVAVEAHSVKV